MEPRFADPTQVNASARPIAAASVVHQEINDEAVLLDLKSEQYFGLDSVGTRAWALMDGTRSLNEIATALAQHYDASFEQIIRDLCGLCSALVDAGLVEIRRS
jgi:hypothetical protein